MLICQCNAIHRRDVMCGGGAALLSAIVATLIGSEKPVRAETVAGKVPACGSARGRRQLPIRCRAEPEGFQC